MSELPLHVLFSEYYDPESLFPDSEIIERSRSGEVNEAKGTGFWPSVYKASPEHPPCRGTALTRKRPRTLPKTYA